MTTLSTSFQNLARAVSAYASEEYTDARRLTGTELIGTDARISTNDEDFYGTIRWDKPLGTLSYVDPSTGADTAYAASGGTVINYATQDDTKGNTTNFATDVAQYIKSVRTHGASDYMVTQVITQRDGAIAKIARDFGVTRARDEDASIFSILNGVINSEVAVSSVSATAANKYGQALTTAGLLNSAAGFYYDLNSSAGANSTAGAKKLIDTTLRGGNAANALWKAAAAGYGDVEPDYFYLVIDPLTYADMRSANLLDLTDRVTDGNIEFDTILNGKFRLIVTRNTALSGKNLLGTQGTTQPVNAGSVRTSLLMLPASISMQPIAVPNPVAFNQYEEFGSGSGKRFAWYRWGYVMHPVGYSWSGSVTGFAKNGADGATIGTAASSSYSNSFNWTRKVVSVAELGIFPIFHA